MQGDIVLTLSGGELIAQPVKWIGQRRIDLTAHPRPETVAPVRIRRGAFADNMPHSDLLVSPDHAVFVDGKLICARQLVNGTTIRQEKGWTSVEYFHVELDAHAILLAEGLPAESYLNTGNHGFFANSDEPLVLHPDLTDETDYPTREAGSCAPFVWDEASVRPVWQRLAERADGTGPAGAEARHDHRSGAAHRGQGPDGAAAVWRERAVHLRPAEGRDRGAPGLARRLADGCAAVAGGSPLPRGVCGADRAARRERDAARFRSTIRACRRAGGRWSRMARRCAGGPAAMRCCRCRRWMARRCWRSAPATAEWPM